MSTEETPNASLSRHPGYPFEEIFECLHCQSHGITQTQVSQANNTCPVCRAPADQLDMTGYAKMKINSSS